MNLLDIKNLSLELETPQGTVKAIEKANLTIKEGEIHGLMGESGSGKSLIAKTIIGVINRRWKITADRLYWRNMDLLALSASQRRNIMRNELAFIPQDAAASLDPTATIASQIDEIFPQERSLLFSDYRIARNKSIIQLLHKVGIKDHQMCLDSYPAELTDDVCQKLVIALALAKKPKLLIADEPTSQMESVSQQNIFKLLNKFNLVHGMSMLLVSHDISLLAKLTNSLTVMYCGQTLESGDAKTIYKNPLHPYTHSLVNTDITMASNLTFKDPLPTLKGVIPNLQHLPIGCRVGPRCPNAQKDCVKTPPTKKYHSHHVNCHYPMGDGRKPCKEKQ